MTNKMRLCCRRPPVELDDIATNVDESPDIREGLSRCKLTHDLHILVPDYDGVLSVKEMPACYYLQSDVQHTVTAPANTRVPNACEPPEEKQSGNKSPSRCKPLSPSRQRLPRPPKSIYQKRKPQATGTPPRKPATNASQAQRDHEAAWTAQALLIEQFVKATSSLQGQSPLRDLFLKIGRFDPSVTSVALNSELRAEMKSWMPARQAAAVRLLGANPFVTSVDLNGCKLEDEAGGVLAEVLRETRSLRMLNVEGNDLRESGLVALVEALRVNTSLQELRINHQRFTISTPVEEALHIILHGRHNRTLLKLGLVVRHEMARNRVNAALMANIDAQRLARVAGRRRRSGDGGVSGVGVGHCRGGGGGVTVDGMAPPRRQVSTKIASFAAGLDGLLAPFDVEHCISELRCGRIPNEAGGNGRAGVLNLNNDTKFVRCTAEQKHAVIRACEGCAELRAVEMANVQLGDEAAALWAKVLRANLGITSLNLEGNRIASAGIEAIACVLSEGYPLIELRIDHQVGGTCSAQAEMSLARAIEGHHTLQKLSYTCRNTQSRDLIERTLMRNRDQTRIRRQSTQHLLKASTTGQTSVPTFTLPKPAAAEGGRGGGVGDRMAQTGSNSEARQVVQHL